MNLEQLEAKARAKQQKNQAKNATSITRSPTQIAQQAINETIGIHQGPNTKQSDNPNVQILLERINKYEAEIEALKLMGAKGVEPTKNQEKILVAIRNEILNQDKKTPVVTRSMFIKTYKVSSRLLDSSIKELLSKEIISRKKVVYAGALATFEYEIVGQAAT